MGSLTNTLKNSKCPLCGNVSTNQLSAERMDDVFVSCETCGRFLIHNDVFNDYNGEKIALQRCNLVYEFLLRKPLYTVKFDLKKYYRFFYEEKTVGEVLEPWIINVAGLMKNYPKNVGEKLDRILLNLAVKYPNIGDVFSISELPQRLLFLETTLSTERDTLFEYLVNSLFIISQKQGLNTSDYFKLTAKAWERINELTQKQKEINQGFIAMSFRDETKEINDGFIDAIKACGYAPVRIDAKEHNNYIVPEIFHEIDQSKFIVVDVTYPNYGAYYEAGYAQALGKQVIICCRETEFKSKEKSARPHFDIAQKSTIVWIDIPDLIKRLKARITATVGDNK